MQTKITYISNFSIDKTLRHLFKWKIYLRQSKQFVWETTEPLTYEQVQQFIKDNPNLGKLRAYARKF